MPNILVLTSLLIVESLGEPEYLLVACEKASPSYEQFMLQRFIAAQSERLATEAGKGLGCSSS